MDRKPSPAPGFARFLITAIALAVEMLARTQLTLAAEAARIDSINPSCASVGEQVTITGIGFGANNVKITVGGVSAQVVTATGNKATFLVPQGVPPGVTIVTATNPGGQTGSISFRVKGPEVCGNKVDDDCDGSTDEGFDVGTACTVGVGACTRSGTKVCTADGSGTVCMPRLGAPRQRSVTVSMTIATGKSMTGLGPSLAGRAPVHGRYLPVSAAPPSSAFLAPQLLRFAATISTKTAMAQISPV